MDAIQSLKQTYKNLLNLYDDNQNNWTDSECFQTLEVCEFINETIAKLQRED